MGRSPSRRRTARAVARVGVAGLLLLAVPKGGVSQASADGELQITYEQYRALFLEQAAPASKKKGAPPPDLKAAQQAFEQLVVAQAKLAAARQSLDRLSGWSRVIQQRYAAQSASTLEVEMIRFAEAKVNAEVALLGAERRRAAERASVLVGRSGSALVALPSNSGEESGAAAAEEDLLAQGQQLLSKMYQSYLFEGTPLSTLLWQEREIYRTEAEYRVGMALASAQAAER